MTDTASALTRYLAEMDDAATLFTLGEVRISIDELDRQISALLAQRQTWVVRAGALMANEDAVRAPGRVEQVIQKVRGLAQEQGASPDMVEATYRSMISAFIDLEISVQSRS